MTVDMTAGTKDVGEKFCFCSQPAKILSTNVPVYKLIATLMRFVLKLYTVEYDPEAGLREFVPGTFLNSVFT